MICLEKIKEINIDFREKCIIYKINFIYNTFFMGGNIVLDSANKEKLIGKVNNVFDEKEGDFQPENELKIIPDEETIENILEVLKENGTNKKELKIKDKKFEDPTGGFQKQTGVKKVRIRKIEEKNTGEKKYELTLKKKGDETKQEYEEELTKKEKKKTEKKLINDFGFTLDEKKKKNRTQYEINIPVEINGITEEKKVFIMLEEYTDKKNKKLGKFFEVEYIGNNGNEVLKATIDYLQKEYGVDLSQVKFTNVGTKKMHKQKKVDEWYDKKIQEVEELEKSGNIENKKEYFGYINSDIRDGINNILEKNSIYKKLDNLEELEKQKKILILDKEGKNEVFRFKKLI